MMQMKVVGMRCNVTKRFQLEKSTAFSAVAPIYNDESKASSQFVNSTVLQDSVRVFIVQLYNCYILGSLDLKTLNSIIPNSCKCFNIFLHPRRIVFFVV